MKLLLVALSLLITTAWANSPRNLISLELDDFAYGMTIINSYGMDVAGVDRNRNVVDVIINQEQLEILRDYGLFNVGKVLKDMGFKGSNDFNDSDIDLSYFFGFSSSSVDEKYKTPDEIEQILKEYNQKYPKITKLEVIGQSLEGRDIFAIKISDNARERELSEPTILFNSLHHAREVMTPEVALDIIDQLVTGYGKKINVTRWVKGAEIWVIPMVNPDGNNMVWTEDNWWRKNTRGGYGVDLNRNYPYNWNACNGSSGSTSSQTYRGEFGGSEPETQVIMSFVERVRPVFDISYHSYSELVLYPFGCAGNKADDIVVSIGKQIAELLDYEPGTPWEILYSADGGDMDWMYGVYQVIPYVIEVNSSAQGFQPSYDRWRDETVEKNRAAWQHLLKRLLGAGVRGIVRDADGAGIGDYTITVEQKVDGEYQQVMVYNGHPDGTYHLVLDQGSYRLTFNVEGKEPIVKKKYVWPWLTRYNPKFK